MRKRHSLVNGRKKAVALLLSLPILAILLLLLLSPNHGRTSPANPSAIPKLAYLISAAHGDALRAKRLLKAVYHPRNYYLLRIDGSASPDERQDLTQYAASERVFAKFGNVRVVPSADSATLKGPTEMSATLHAAAILLREGRDWSWFVNLDAADYPLVSQDDVGSGVDAEEVGRGVDIVTCVDAGIDADVAISIDVRRVNVGSVVNAESAARAFVDLSMNEGHPSLVVREKIANS